MKRIPKHVNFFVFKKASSMRKQDLKKTQSRIFKITKIMNANYPPHSAHTLFPPVAPYVFSVCTTSRKPHEIF